MRTRLFFLLPSFVFLVWNSSNAQDGIVRDMKTEHLPDPIGLDEARPRFTWKWVGSESSVKASRWRLVVEELTSAGTGLDMWDTAGAQTPFPLLVYNGKNLKPFTGYRWCLFIWDAQGKMINSSEARFEMGMMQTGIWQGAWISDGQDQHTKRAPLFRKSFVVKKKLRSARAYISAAGLYELSINGNRVGNQLLDPAYTRFDRRLLYTTYDVTSQIQSGENVIGSILGNGWYNHQSTAVWNFHQAPWRNRPAFCMDLRLRYEDGSEEVISTGRDWKTHFSDIVFNSIYTGEHVDRTLAIDSWDRPGFVDTAWRNASYRSAPAPLLVAQAMPAIRQIELLKPDHVQHFGDSMMVVKFPKNMAGVTRIRVKGAAGTVVRLKHGERLRKDGRVDQSNLDVHYRPVGDGDPFQTDIFVLSGNGFESFQPRFNYKGFQYVEISWNKPVEFAEPLAEAIRMSSDLPVAGIISTSHSLLEPLWQATNNSYLSNMFGYPTDCPQREKNGWTGDAHIAQETGLFNFDGIAVYEKWMADHRDEQQPNGVLPSIIPTGGWGYDWGNGPDWTSTVAIVPWNLYIFYGDLRPLQKGYEAIRKYVDHIDALYPTGITSWGLGDWIPVKSQTPVPFTSTAYYYKDVSILAATAGLLGYTGDQQRYQQLAEKIKTEFNRVYFDSVRAIYGTGLQTELSVALHFGLVPTEQRQRVADQLAARVLRDSVRLDVGLLGTKSILNALSENGHADLAYQLATREQFPSWGWWIKNGATSLYENWPIDAASDISMNHIMFGEVGAWMYKGIAGIQPDARQPGFRHFFLHPYMPAELTEFKACYDSPLGEICSGWSEKGRTRIYRAVVPAFSSASLKLAIPAGKKLYQKGNMVAAKSAFYETELPPGEHLFEIR